MPFDGLAMRAVAAELNQKLVGGRVEKALQPERDEVHLLIRNAYQNYRLLISASAALARVHLTNIAKPNPERAPVFCMLLRKHLIGGKLLEVSQHGMDRILSLRFSVIDELGLEGEMTLHAEIMGRHSNAVLVSRDGTIVDSLKRITEEKSRVREVLPGLPYEFPPAQDKLDPTELDAQEFLKLLTDSTDKPLWHALGDGVSGIGQATAKELLAVCGLDAELASTEIPAAKLEGAAHALEARFSAFRLGRFEPCAVLGADGAPTDFYPFTARSAKPQNPYTGMSEAAEAYYAELDKRDRLVRCAQDLKQALTAALSRVRSRLEKQQADLSKSENADMYRLNGELLTANLHLQAKGEKSIDVINYYSEDMGTVTVELDPTLSVADNAKKYFKKYDKAKAAKEKLAMLVEASQQEADYLDGQLQFVESCTGETELEEIRGELVAEGYLKRQTAPSKRRVEPSRPKHYRSPDGYEIYVGRNNLQNDFLTLKFARSDDVWMHTKKIPGSHVIIKAQGGAVSEEALRMGALLSAYHSRARGSSGVPVDYTQKKNVKKPAGGKPGFVIYTTNRTIAVTPDEAKVKELQELKD